MEGEKFMKNLNVASVSDAGVLIDPQWQLEIYDIRMVSVTDLPGGNPPHGVVPGGRGTWARGRNVNKVIFYFNLQKRKKTERARRKHDDMSEWIMVRQLSRVGVASALNVPEICARPQGVWCTRVCAIWIMYVFNCTSPAARSALLCLLIIDYLNASTIIN